MKTRKPNEILEKLIKDNPELFACKESIEKAFKIASECYSNNGKILICGNGGSASDSEHIVGELMKGIMLRRPISADKRNRIIAEFQEEGIYLSNKLQGALPAISLVSQTSIYSAYINDVEPDMVFAQQVYGYVVKDDVIIGLSTSGNSRNVVNAMKVGKAFGAKLIGMTGENDSEISIISDITLRSPAKETYRIQEYHLMIYHAFCAMIKVAFFKE